MNLALKGAPRCDYWGCFDTPNDLHLAAIGTYKAFRKKPALVTHKNRAMQWEKWWVQHLIDRSEWPSVHTPQYGPLWFKLCAKSPFYSFFGVMSFAIQEGATHLNIIGCDLAGQEYFDEQASGLGRVKARPKRVWDMRWKKERDMLARVMEAAPEHGVTISGVDLAKLA